MRQRWVRSGAEITIEPYGYNPAVGHAPWVVAAYHHDVYEEHSVLAGQPRRSFLGGYASVEEALVDYPEAMVTEGSTRMEFSLPRAAPDWFDPADAGESWDGE